RPPFPTRRSSDLGGRHGVPRPRHRRFTESTLDPVWWHFPCGPAHSCAAPARSDVRSTPERSALPKTGRGWCVEVTGKCEVKSLRPAARDEGESRTVRDQKSENGVGFSLLRKF